MTKLRIKILLLHAFMAAVLYSGAAGIFIYSQSYLQSWLLYIGNVLFGIAIAFFLYRHYKRSNYTLKISQLVTTGQITSVIGIVISCVFCLLLLIILVPDIFLGVRTNSNIWKNAPEQLQQEKNNYLVALMMDAVIGNISTGSFIAILFPFILVRYQKGE